MSRRATTPPEHAANQHVAKRIRATRKAQGLSQEALAHRAGLDRSFLGRIERNESNMTLGTIAIIAHALDVTVTHLVDGI